jgi:transcriptional regulator with XRE-family HTH domain
LNRRPDRGSVATIGTGSGPLLPGAAADPPRLQPPTPFPLFQKPVKSVYTVFLLVGHIYNNRYFGAREKTEKKRGCIMWGMKKTKKKIGEQESFGKRLARFRKAMGLTQGELGAAVNVSIRALSAYEREECEPSIELLVLLGEQLGVSVDELLGNGGKDTSRLLIDPRWAKRFKQIEFLSGRKQQAILQVLDMALKSAS